MSSKAQSNLDEQSSQVYKHGALKSAVKSGVKGGVKGVIGSLPGGTIFVEASNAVDDIKLNRRLDMIEQAIEELNISLGQLGSILKKEPELAELWGMGIEASGDARTKEKIKAFSKILADATGHNNTDLPTKAPISLSRVYLHIIRDLDDEHIRVMKSIESLENITPDPPIEGIIGNKPGAKFEDLRNDLPDISQIIKILINQLITLDLIRGVTMNTWGQGGQRTDRYTLTDLGTELLKYLRA